MNVTEPQCGTSYATAVMVWALSHQGGRETVELRGIEPLASSMRPRRSAN